MTTTDTSAGYRAHLPANTPPAGDTLVESLAEAARLRAWRMTRGDKRGVADINAVAGEHLPAVLARLAAAENRLDVIAAKTEPCPPPDVAEGYDSCAHGLWPCPATEVAWIAAGLDVGEQVAAAARDWRTRMMAEAVAEAMLVATAGSGDE